MTTTIENIQVTDPGAGEPVLVAVDFSGDSLAAWNWAARFAASNDAPLVVLHVVHDPASNPGFYRRDKSESKIPMAEVAETMMEEFLEEVRKNNPDLFSQVRLDTRVVPGLPHSRIVDVARLLKVGLIVLGSRGLSGLPHALLGSTAERVVELSHVPVVVVKSEEHGKLKKKERKATEKRQKRERRHLKELLGLRK